MPSLKKQPVLGTEPTKFTIMCDPPVNWLPHRRVYPAPAVLMEDGIREELYKDFITIRIPVKQTVGGHTFVTMSGSLRYQPCNETMCFPPKRLDFSFSIPVKED